MTVDVYTTSSDPMHVTKQLTPIGSYSGDVRDAVSIDRPVIMVEATVSSGNYAYIAEFGRYYWITDRDIIRTNLTELTLKSDPLMSFSAEIAALPVYVTRAEQEATELNPTGYNVYLPDRTVQKTARTFTKVTIDPYVPKFEYPDSGLDTARQYILGVIG